MKAGIDPMKKVISKKVICPRVITPKCEAGDLTERSRAASLQASSPHASIR
jgi:hypothetical protein